MSIINSFIKKNTIRFMENVNNTAILAQIEYVTFVNVYRIKIDSIVLSKCIFDKTREITISGFFDYIQPDIFKEFEQVNRFYLVLYNLRQLFHTNMNWLYYLNYFLLSKTFNLDYIKANSIFFLVVFGESYNDINYFYPEEDFCLFKQFPHERFVFAKLIKIVRMFTVSILFVF